MASFYLETSGVFKRYRTERGSDVVNELYDGKTDAERFVSSYLTAGEIEATAARALRGRVLTLGSYRTIIGSFTREFTDLFDIRPVSNETVREAIGLSRTYALRAPDAIHLATARLVRQGGVSDLVYVTSDRELVEAARRDGFDLLDPEYAGAIGDLRGYR